MHDTPVLVPGYNSRPVVEALLQAGMDPVPLDYFGDVDLVRSAPDGLYYRRDHAGPASGFPAWVKRTIRALAGTPRRGRPHQREKPLVLPCSGFDDDIDAWTTFHQAGTVLGNTPPVVALARDSSRLRAIIEAAGTGVGFLPTLNRIVDSTAGIDAFERDVVGSIPFPAVIKPVPGGGGAGIEIVANEQKFHEWISCHRRVLESSTGAVVSHTVQQLVNGPGLVHASILACNESVACLTAQVIGESNLHAPGPFSYCGNIVPLSSVHPDLEWLDVVAKRLTRCLHLDAGLAGLYGVDLVIFNGEAWFMEINPRVPGSLEPAIIALDRNLIVDHVASFLPGHHLNHDPCHATAQAIKHVLFSPVDLVMPALGSLQLIGAIKDITPPGTPVRRGDPVLTYLLKGTLDEAARNARLAMLEVEVVYRALVGDSS